MSGLFDTFTIAKRGLNVNQGAINTTSHNIANANTEGYSRQRAVAETTKPFGGMSRFDTCSVGQVGTGAEITSIQRIRDYFIDYQVRSETGTSGFYTQASETLYKVEDILGEPSDKGIQQLTNNFFNAFQEVSKNGNKANVKTVAIQSAASLADAINYAYNQLEKTRDDSQKLLQTNVIDVNSYLNQINELNKQIKGISAVGQVPNDLMDKRDLLVDKLSNKFGIKLDRDSFETINLSSTEYPNASLVKSDPNDINYNRLSYVKGAKVESDGGAFKLTVEYYPLGNEQAAVKSFTVKGTNKSDLDEIKDSMLQNRILLADKDGNAMTETVATKATSTTPGRSIVEIPALADGSHTVDTKVTEDGAIAITIGSSTISRDKDGVITNSTSYSVTNNSDGTMYIKLNSDLTIKVEKDGSIAVPAESFTADISTNAQAKLSLKKAIFQTYKYDSDRDSEGNTVNSVDNKNVKGDIAANQSVQDNIKEYMDNLDRLAAGLAYSVNAIQTGSIKGTDASGNVITSQGLSGNLIFVTYDESTQKNKSIDDGITAKNIRINKDLITDPQKLNCSTTSTSGEGDALRAKAIANLNILKMNLSSVANTEDLSTWDREKFLKQIGINTTSTASGFTDSTCLSLNTGTDGSTVDSYYKTMVNNIGVIKQESDRIAANQETILANLQEQKSEVSGVSLDEEMTNLIQFQHAYQANAKIISTVNELLDVVINGLKR
ncbi:flagellar hook-associated protein FlgK [Clostridium saccharobutylicum]|nr:flagellar hook-associated protein FlgK [Clostridium saccharobutylicum]MBC2400508.1 flagellar hook-associated protein FlgK [Clostridium saccharobutylicum]MBC2410990.1 flagellar hook-associated protein FlgK [Clostridium saccharobutylicum]MBC2434926.1 flagellar hook-associated protein FlgK [Clostridium saccharobutylicum]MBC2439336.1 flagellar hook-associated protein FlgK [Clostridium saccharobutylicum]MBC2443375.1 flagellar hook-associated protein FlgK [Clostridium saccharobutylicum]